MLVIGNRTFDIDRPLVMGILNVTPDSFYDGGRYFDTSAAVGQALKMVSEGADIIDIGGESSRPGSVRVDEEEEIERVIPVIEAVTRQTDAPVSIDTWKAGVARRAVKAGAWIVNDISALRSDPDMAGVIAETGCSVVLMHMQGTPETMQNDPRYGDVVEDILAFLNERVSYALEWGIPKDRIIVDPGIGFGKTLDHNLTILRNVGRFRETGCPVLIGASRKRLVGMITGAPLDDRLWGTAAITAHCVLEGAAIHRVHDVREMRHVCDVAAAIRFGTARAAGR